jgi:hypothetical protein
MPLGSKRTWLNLSTSACGGTPLQRVGNRLRERVGESRDGRSFLGHHEEDLARLPIVEQADRDVSWPWMSNLCVMACRSSGSLRRTG